MKKVLLIVVVAALALTLVPLAIAGGHGGGGHKNGKYKFNLVGNVVAPDSDPAVEPAVDPAADPDAAPVVADPTEPAEPAVVSTIFIKVKAGSHIKGLRGTEKMFDVAPGVKVWQLTADGAVEGRLADIEPDDRVKVKGWISKDGSKVYTITSIKYRDLTPVVEETAPPAAR
ncbi:MAG TPA: hypothetical protein VFZ86_05680 [Thermoleophilia bacterium]|nr:hypothetical protein [Thermoleophilia bacterium]